MENEISNKINSVKYQLVKNNKNEQSHILSIFNNYLTSNSDIKLYNRLYNCNKANNNILEYFENIYFTQNVITRKTALKFLNSFI